MSTKSMQRRLAYDARNALKDKQQLSQLITDTLLQQTDYQRAATVLWYLHCRSEVQTYPAVAHELGQQAKKIVIPYCTQDKQGDHCLGLWALEDMSELVKGTWDILEPPKTRWGESSKRVNPEHIDVIVVPGVAFDRQGGRLGNGAGYYDRLFAQIKAHTKLLALGFDCQIVEQVCMQQHDIYMDTVITETTLYKGRGR